MRQLITLLLLTLTLIPAAYSFNEHKRVIDIYQEQLEKLRLSQAKLERLTEQQADKVALIQRLIADYQNALKTTTQGIKDQYQAQLEQQLADIKTAIQQIQDQYRAQLQQLTAEHADTEAAYLKKLEAAADLADHHYQSARKTDDQIQSLLTKLGQSAEQILKLTQVISTLQQQVSTLQQETSALRKETSAQQQQIEYHRDVMRGQYAIRTFSGHSNYVWSVAFSPNGDYALSGSYDNTVKLWDVSTGQLIRTFSGHTSAVWSVAFSPNGDYALSGSWDDTLKLWDVSTGQLIRTFSGHSNYNWSFIDFNKHTFGVIKICYHLEFLSWQESLYRQ